MNKTIIITQFICFAIQTSVLILAILLSNYWLAAWCAVWQYYALYKIVQELGG
jgi:hypothetical protein